MEKAQGKRLLRNMPEGYKETHAIVSENLSFISSTTDVSQEVIQMTSILLTFDYHRRASTSLTLERYIDQASSRIKNQLAQFINIITGAASNFALALKLFIIAITPEEQNELNTGENPAKYSSLLVAEILLEPTPEAKKQDLDSFGKAIEYWLGKDIALNILDIALTDPVNFLTISSVLEKKHTQRKVDNKKTLEIQYRISDQFLPKPKNTVVQAPSKATQHAQNILKSHAQPKHNDKNIIHKLSNAPQTNGNTRHR